MCACIGIENKGLIFSFVGGLIDDWIHDCVNIYVTWTLDSQYFGVKDPTFLVGHLSRD